MHTGNATLHREVASWNALLGSERMCRGGLETEVLRNLTDAVDGFLLGKTHVIMDCDPIFTTGVRDMLRHVGAKPARLPRRSPNLNAFIADGPLARRERLGGLLNYYYREAA